ncbi:monosaccharide ABC transporter ATP-binding protein (CUT2 family) [Natranaerovirga pectinivora]|uniref:Monosaccharide ABC transporter ATP-binding protein (CUT2 family) n=1 Tax=Natranaerovirga pectinivora TaxID=682400 RepID=A0A4R3MMP8_9FIRM|nr:sugar ABC transporter ATP-binding protein [Natranaerovirga pectinivora]TCT15535.1 monosaccharide ABC transporter ATP-binding protein (CUT2 family) [Natranaerovirga pectinivora]
MEIIKNGKNEKPLIRVEKLSKHFGVTIALNEVSFEIPKGVICGLVGENGSGKSTFASIFAGIIEETKGEIYFEDKLWKPCDVLEAQKNGVAMIVQETGTIENITVAENIFLGQEMLFSNGLFISRKKMFAAAQEILDDLEISSFRADTPTHRLDMQGRKLVEIAKAMYWKPKVFTVDETTTVLSHTGRQLLYSLMKKLTNNGTTVIFISHDLEELEEQCDIISVLRDGEFVGTLKREEFDTDRLKQMMIGRNLEGNYYHADDEGYSDEVVLRAENITTLEDLLCFNIELHKGEVLGIGGLSDCGMHTLGKALFGAEKVLDGKVNLGDGTVIDNTKTAVEHKMGYMSKNRDKESLALNATVKENIVSIAHDVNRMFGPIISFKKEAGYAKKQIKDLSIKCASPNHLVSTLSGGNKQKIVFGKWMGVDSQIIIMDCPTRGVDIGVKAAMYKLIYDMKKSGKSILLISEELPELIGMSDRIIIMRDGEISAEIQRSEGFNEQKLIDAMI